MSQPTLDPQAQAVLDAALKSGLPPVYTLPVDEARQRMRAAFISDRPLEEVAEVKDALIPGPVGGVPIRVYRPESGELPAVVFFHGGGFTLNDLDTHDRVCRRIANGSGTVVVAVGFRRAPEAPYPAPIEDAFLATVWVSAHAQALGIDRDRIAVAGDSSGATTATVVALLARDRGFPTIRYQALMYPQTYAPDRSRGSYVERGAGYSLNADFVEWIWAHYCPDGAELDDPYLCPGNAKDLSGLPKALVVTNEFDPLRDEGREYARRLEEAGVDVEYLHVDNQMHGFIMQTAVIDRARELLDGICDTLRKNLA